MTSTRVDLWTIHRYQPTRLSTMSWWATTNSTTFHRLAILAAQRMTRQMRVIERPDSTVLLCGSSMPT